MVTVRLSTLVASNLLAALTVMASPDPLPPAAAYDAAIASAVPGTQVDRRPELRRCIALWIASRSSGKNRIQGADADAAGNDKSSVLLEIGNSAFPHYEFVLIQGERLFSSFGAPTDISNAQLQKKLGTLLEGASPFDRLEGAASSSLDDGDCYFLTIRRPSSVKMVALYDPLSGPSTTLRSFVAEVLNAAKSR